MNIAVHGNLVEVKRTDVLNNMDAKKSAEFYENDSKIPKIVAYDWLQGIASCY